MPSNDCRAKNPNLCRHHGTGRIATKMMDALKNEDFSAYEECRQATESGEVTWTSQRPVITMDDAVNAVKAECNTWDYNEMPDRTKRIRTAQQFSRLEKAAPHMTGGLVTPKAVEAYLQEKHSQEGTNVESQSVAEKEIADVNARHVLMNVAKEIKTVGR